MKNFFAVVVLILSPDCNFGQVELRLSLFFRLTREEIGVIFYLNYLSYFIVKLNHL
ncbi:MAG: hypothetical protein LBT09_04365 [Planctomycetaceae bacterium]|nr:hypothetical protein [Planctomycetaceae bacterium]